LFLLDWKHQCHSFLALDGWNAGQLILQDGESWPERTVCLQALLSLVIAAQPTASSHGCLVEPWARFHFFSSSGKLLLSVQTAGAVTAAPVFVDLKRDFTCACGHWNFADGESHNLGWCRTVSGHCVSRLLFGFITTTARPNFRRLARFVVRLTVLVRFSTASGCVGLSWTLVPTNSRPLPLGILGVRRCVIATLMRIHSVSVEDFPLVETNLSHVETAEPSSGFQIEDEFWTLMECSALRMPACSRCISRRNYVCGVDACAPLRHTILVFLHLHVEGRPRWSQSWWCQSQ
jgi:hypothetical protein